VDVDRHAAAVVAHFATAVRVQDHVDLLGVPGQGFVHRVVDHFLRQMIGARGVGVHAGTALDRFQAGEDFDVGGVVARVHGAKQSSGRMQARRMAARGGGTQAGGAGGATGRCRTRHRGDVASVGPQSADARR